MTSFEGLLQDAQYGLSVKLGFEFFFFESIYCH